MVRTFSGGLRTRALAFAPVTWWLAAFVVIAELVACALGVATLGLAAAALVAPGFALGGLLPEAVRRSPVARAAAAPALGLAVTSIALISLARIGVPLTGLSVRLVVVALLAAALLVPRDEPAEEAVATQEGGPSSDGDANANPAVSPPACARRIATELALLATVLGLTFLLGWQVVGSIPVPGDDWAKYLLYADEIRRHGSLLLDNDLWMGGRPFSEDPGIPSLEGAALLMTGAPAGGLVHVILLLQLVQVAATFAVVRVHAGLVGAVAAAALLALVPATQNILGWHGLANVGALAILALVLGQLAAWLSQGLDRRAELGLAITLVGVAAAHRLTAAFLVATLGCVILAAIVFGPRLRLLAGAARTLAFTVVVGAVVATDLQVRAGQSGGTLPYTSYLSTKLDLTLALRDLTPVLVVLAVFTLIGLGARRRLPRWTWPPLGLAVVSIVLTYAWLLRLPMYYSRTVFFLPAALAPIAAAGLVVVVPWLRHRSRAAVVAATAVVAAAAVALFAGSWRQADQVRDYYGFASPVALRGLDQLGEELGPDEIVATDRCWSFLATWLLHTRTYPALEEQDIQPKAELVVARRSAAIMRGTAEGRALMRSTPVRWALLDPTCPVNGGPLLPPGRVRFASKRLAIVELDPAGRARTVAPSPSPTPRPARAASPTIALP